MKLLNNYADCELSEKYFMIKKYFRDLPSLYQTTNGGKKFDL